jgi:transcriptional regulator with XRE-family HTH domain
MKLGGLMATLGARVRELRISRNLTLEQVSAETGLSVSFLSMVERNKASISVENLEKLARYFQIHIVHFFNSQDENSVSITRREQILKTMEARKFSQAVVTLLANKPNARMEPLLVLIAPGKEEPHFRKHEADTLLYVLSGEALLLSENGDQLELHQGDLAYYVNYPHRRLVNASTEIPLLIISITAPPTSSLDDLIGARQGSWVMSADSK